MGIARLVPASAICPAAPHHGLDIPGARRDEGEQVKRGNDAPFVRQEGEGHILCLSWTFDHEVFTLDSEGEASGTGLRQECAHAVHLPSCLTRCASGWGAATASAHTCASCHGG